VGDLSSIYGAGSGPCGAAAYDPSNKATQAINPPELFDGSALFSQIVVSPPGRLMWTAGLIGVTPDNRLAGPDKPSQFTQVFRNAAVAIAAAGCTPANCVRLREYIVDYSEADLALLREQIVGLFPAGVLPTNTLVPVVRLGRDGALIEIELDCIVP
jgi:enamine deaminase RidA (YjgF/YER057c/UK114 family)